MKKTWSELEIEKLKNTYPTTPIKDLENIFFRKFGAIERKALSLGLHRSGKNGIKWTDIEINILKNIYQNSSRKFIEDSLPNRSWKAIREKAVYLNLIRDSKIIWEETVKTNKLNNLEKYGVESPFQLEKVKEQSKKTNLEKYGAEYPMQSPEVLAKSKNTLLKNYGVEHPLQSEKLRKRAKDTTFKNYGVEHPLQSEEIKDQMRKTNIERYNVENTFQGETFKERIKQTNLEKYGVENPMQSKEIKESAILTNIERYGFKTPSENPEIMSKIKNTNMDRYGVAHPFQSEKFKEIIKKTNLERYGVENPSQNIEIMNQVKQTNLKKYGVTSVLALEEYRNREKALESIKRNGSFTKSKPEIAFIEHLKKYVDEDLIHQIRHLEIGYLIDYYSPKYASYIQFDGIFWHGKNKDLDYYTNHPKFDLKKSMVKKIYGTKLRDIIQNNEIPNLVRFWEDEVKSAIKNKTVPELIYSKMKDKIHDFTLPSV